MTKERWKTLKIKEGSHIEVSNLGRFKNTRTQQIYKLHAFRRRLKLSFRSNNRTFYFDAARLVYNAFKKEKIPLDKLPYFKDNNLYNIALSNLTSESQDHPNFLKYLEIRKKIVENWLKIYKKSDFISVRHFSKISGILHGTVYRHFYAIKRYLNVKNDLNVNFYNLCRCFLNEKLNLNFIEVPKPRTKRKYVSKLIHYFINNKTACRSNQLFRKYEDDITKVTCKLCQICYKKHINKTKITYEKINFPGETWKDIGEITHVTVEVSNFGRFRNKSTGKIWKLVKSSIKHKRLQLIITHKKKEIRLDAACVIYKYFIDMKNTLNVYFKDKNPENLCYSNLTIERPVYTKVMKAHLIYQEDIEKWTKKYTSDDFRNIKHFAKISGMYSEKIRARIRYMKAFLNLSKNYKIDLPILIARFLNTTNPKIQFIETTSQHLTF